jgi:hypothetical protein
VNARVLALVGALALPASPHRYDEDALAALDAMEKAAAATNDYTMRLVKRELRGTELTPEETIVVKWQRPQRIYLHARGTFPDINWNLDPYGSLAMGHSHHPVPEASLLHLVDLVLDNVRRARAKNVGALVFEGHETVLGRPVSKLEATAPPTGKTPSLGKGQTLWDIARVTGQSMNVILHANADRGWRQADHPEAGDAVIVPDFYAGRVVLWIDEELLRVNVGLTDADFDPNNPAYRF